MDKEMKKAISAVAARETSFAPDAYFFTAEAVSFAANILRQKEKSKTTVVHAIPPRHHLSALEVLQGARILAKEKFGAVSVNVLASWGIVDAADLGRVVYLLIEAGILAASPSDDPQDFNIEFDFGGDCCCGKTSTAAVPPLDI